MKFLLLSIGRGVVIVVFALVSAAAAGPLVCTEPPPTNSSSDMCDWGVGGSAYRLKYYRNFDLLTSNDSITLAVIVVHGRRDKYGEDRSYNYYEPIYDAAVDRGIENSTLIIAPYFSRHEFKVGGAWAPNPFCGGNSSSDGRLCWEGGNNDYTAGGNASNDIDNINSSSYAIVNDMIDHLANGGHFPKLKTIIVTGQSAGGQFTQRYAMAGASEPAGITLRYVACNPESSAYLSGARPTQSTKDSFPNLRFEATCDCDSNPDTPDVPCKSDPPPSQEDDEVLADLETWSTLPYAFNIPYDYVWDGNECYADGSYDNWPDGIGDVSVNEYMQTEVVSGNKARTQYLARNVVILNGIDDNHYMAENFPCDYTRCPIAVKGDSRAERNALFFNHVCDLYDCSKHGFATVTVDQNGNGILEPNERITHGRVIYESDATRAVLFDGDKPPSIWRQKPLKGVPGEWMTISLSDLVQEYPAGSELLVESGAGYRVEDSSNPGSKRLRPNNGYHGRLFVPVRVRSPMPNAPAHGSFISNRYFLKIAVATKIEWLFPAILTLPLP